MAERNRRSENAEATRRALLDVGRKLFTERGYAGTATEEIVRHARVTRGALYHHFKDKLDLFNAVLEEVNGEVSTKIAERALATDDVWSGVTQGIDAFLDCCLDRSYQRIILLDGPSVLGWERWREIGERHGLGIIRGMLTEAMKQEVIIRQPIEPLAYMLHGALNEAGMHIARADDVETARAEVRTSLMKLIEGLRIRSGA